MDEEKGGGYFMLTESTKQDLREMTDLLKGLDSIGMLIIKSNAAVLLARQELAESRERQQRVTEFSHYNRQQLDEYERLLNQPVREPELAGK